MIKTEMMRYAFEHLRKRKKRSFLTVHSVAIGIAAVTTLISFGMGISDYVNSFAEKMGKDKLIIQARGGAFGAPSLDSNVVLDEGDLEAVEKANGVMEATGVYVFSAEVKYNDQKKYTVGFGSDFKKHPKLLTEAYSLNVAEGQNIDGNDKTKVVLGHNYLIKDKIFSKPVSLRDKIKVNGKEFRVVGFYEAVGNPQDDSQVYFTRDAAEETFEQKSYRFILARSAPGRDTTQIVSSIRKELRDHRDQSSSNEDFFVQTFEQMIATFSLVLDAIVGVVVLVALISVVVAGVNITNTMFAAILERTKEIGVLKAIGSKNIDILIIFVFESGLLSLVGGVFGVLTGYLIGVAAGKAVAAAGYALFKPLFTWGLAAGSLLFAFLVGVLSGLIPAYRASQLKPVDALHYE